MIDITREAVLSASKYCSQNVLLKKLEALFFKLQQTEYIATTEEAKANRWFGYYQKVGEDLGLWSLEEVNRWIEVDS